MAVQRFDCCADLGFSAANTHGNAAEAAAWTQAHGYHRLVIVTASYHMPRSLAEFSAEMPGVELEPWPVEPDGVDLKAWWHDPHALQAAADRICEVSGQPRPDPCRFAKDERDALDRNARARQRFGPRPRRAQLTARPSMTILRSSIFFVWFVLASVLIHLAALPALLMPRVAMLWAGHVWCVAVLWGLGSSPV